MAWPFMSLFNPSYLGLKQYDINNQTMVKQWSNGDSVIYFLINLFLGRCGKSITLVTQFDVKLVHSIEDFISK